MAAAAPAASLRAAWTSHAHVRENAPREGAHLSSAPYERRGHPAETIGGFLAAASIFVSLTGVAYRPLRLIPLALVMALVATGIGGRSARLATWAVGIGALAFAVGMAAAVITSNPLW